MSKGDDDSDIEPMGSEDDIPLFAKEDKVKTVEYNK
jgi:hypothetical protein